MSREPAWVRRLPSKLRTRWDSIKLGFERREGRALSVDEAMNMQMMARFGVDLSGPPPESIDPEDIHELRGSLDVDGLMLDFEVEEPRSEE